MSKRAEPRLMTDFSVCDALSEKLGTYGAGGGGVALVICRHTFTGSFVSSATEENRRNGRCLLLLELHHRHKFLLPRACQRIVEHVFYAQSKSEELNSAYTGPMPHTVYSSVTGSHRP